MNLIWHKVQLRGHEVEYADTCTVRVFIVRGKGGTRTPLSGTPLGPTEWGAFYTKKRVNQPLEDSFDTRLYLACYPYREEARHVALRHARHNMHELERLSMETRR